MSGRLAAMLLFSVTLHGWLLWAAPLPVRQSQLPAGKMVLSLGQLRLKSATAAADEARQAVVPQAVADEPVERQAQREPVAPAEPVVHNAGNAAVREQPAPEQTTPKTSPVEVAQTEPSPAEPAPGPADALTAGPGSSAPARGASDEPVLVQRPTFASPPTPPVYPELARSRRQQGTVLVEVQLSSDGRQLQRKLLQSSGVTSLDEAALAAVKSWRFLPYLENGRARPSRVRLPIRFAL